jgi:hypothetical protein
MVSIVLHHPYSLYMVCFIQVFVSARKTADPDPIKNLNVDTGTDLDADSDSLTRSVSGSTA